MIMLSKGANRLAQRPSRLRYLSRISTVFIRRYSRQTNISPLPSLSKEIKQQRHDLLLKIYAPFHALDESSQEYRDLALSGKVWDNYFTFGDSERLGYDDLQYQYKDLLKEIDEFRVLIGQNIDDFSKALVIEYAHQSVAIEQNPLLLGDSITIHDRLASKLFKNIELAKLEPSDLLQLELPISNEGFKEDESQVNELKNHLLVSQWIAERALLHPGSSGVTEAEMKTLAALTVKGTDAEIVYKSSWGGRVALGDYRKSPISVRFDPLAVFPYHLEVPACIKRFFRWREEKHNTKSLHPLILACQMMVYFVRIHPFPDGNGRMSRILFHDYLVRQGYLPVVILNLDRSEYLTALNQAAEGDPGLLVNIMLNTQLEELQSFYWMKG